MFFLYNKQNSIFMWKNVYVYVNEIVYKVFFFLNQEKYKKKGKGKIKFMNNNN